MARKSHLKHTDAEGRRISLNSVEVEDLTAFQRQSSLFFYLSYCILMLVIILCTGSFLHYLVHHKHEDYGRDIIFSYAIFFGTGNAMLVFRVFGIQFFTEVLHVIMHIIVFIFLLVSTFFHTHEQIKTDILDFYHVFLFPAYMVLAVYIIQCLMSFPLAGFLPGSIILNLYHGSQHHACGGLLTFTLISWNYMLHISMMCATPHDKQVSNHTIYLQTHQPISEPAIIVVSSTVFVLFIFFILLNPTFDYKVRTRVRDKMLGRKKVHLGPKTSLQFKSNAHV